MRRIVGACAAGALLAWGCGGEPLEESCDGERVRGCDPYAYAVVRSATVEPAMIRVGDPTPEGRAHVRVEYDSCGADAPGAHRIAMLARTSRAGLSDGGESLMVIALEELRDDGSTFGDDTARDGVVDVTVPNPFFELPESRTFDLRFEPRLGSCVGEAAEIEYTTGERWEPDAGI